MSAPKLLLVEDDIALAELLEYRFANEGYDVRVTADGDEALVFASEDAPDLVILDWMIEGTSGIEVCRRLRRDKATAHVPIIMLTAREAEDDRIRGLEIGADDYVTKPFSPRELLARVSAVLRRVRPALAGETIEAGDMRLDPVAHRVERRGRQLQIGPTEYRLLKFFMEHPRRVFSRGQLLDAVWGTGSEIEERTVDVHIGEGSDPHRSLRGLRARAGLAAEPTKPPRCLVHMEMVCMGGVVVRAEHRAEHVAGAVAHTAQELGFGVFPIPVAQDADALAILRHKGGDVDCIAGRVFAPIITAADPPTAERAQMVDPGDR